MHGGFVQCRYPSSVSIGQRHANAHGPSLPVTNGCHDAVPLPDDVVWRISRPTRDDSGRCTCAGQRWEDEHAQTGYSTGSILGLRLDLNRGELVAYLGGIRLGVLVSPAVVASHCSGAAFLGVYCHTGHLSGARNIIVAVMRRGPSSVAVVSVSVPPTSYYRMLTIVCAFLADQTAALRAGYQPISPQGLATGAQSRDLGRRHCPLRLLLLVRRFVPRRQRRECELAVGVVLSCGYIKLSFTADC